MNQSNITKWALVAGIVIVLNLFFNYALSLIYKEPMYEAYCPVSQVNEAITTREQCVAVGGQWNENAYYGKPIPASEVRDMVKGYCNPQFKCATDYETARKAYDRNVFVTLVLLGAATLAVGNFFKGNMLLGQALSLAGVLSFIIASMRYWTSANNLLKVVILAIALVLLVWVAMRKFKD